MGIRDYFGKTRNLTKRVTNGRDAVTAGKIAGAAGVAYVVNGILNKTAGKIKQYSPGRIVKRVVTQTEKGVYNLDQAVEKEIKKLPGGTKVMNTNKDVVGWFWDHTIGRGSFNKKRTQDFYRRTKIKVPQHYAIEKKTVTETRIPSTYNVNAANQKGLIGAAGLAVNFLLGVYVLKEGAKHFIRQYKRGKKK
jgi:hypothetical protein